MRINHSYYWLALGLLGAALHLSTAAQASDHATRYDYAAWSRVNHDGSWTRAAEQAVARVALARTHPRDVNSFCPNYSYLSSKDRVTFWVALVSAMARPESNFKPEASYLEPSVRDARGQRVTSRGLLQISQESANQQRYACQIQRAEDLHDPGINLDCTSKILAYWVKQDGQIAAEGSNPVGGARYWSVLRAWRGHLGEIKSFTRQLPGCSRA